MANLTLRSVKGTPLTTGEMDTNFTSIDEELKVAVKGSVPWEANHAYALGEIVTHLSKSYVVTQAGTSHLTVGPTHSSGQAVNGTLDLLFYELQPYTPKDVLDKLKTMDGANSGLDADLLDGLNASATLPVSGDKSSIVSRDASGDIVVRQVTSSKIGPDTDSQHTLPNVADDTITLLAATQTLTNKTIVVANNTITTAASGNLTSTNLNAALNELQLELDSVTPHPGTSTGAHAASAISYAGSPGMTAINVETAIDELSAKKVSRTSDTGSAILPSRTISERDMDTPSRGFIGFNKDTNMFEGYDGYAWGPIGGIGATGGGSGNLQNLAFYENDVLITNNYTIGLNSQRSGATFTIGSPNITYNNHGFVAGQLVMFTTTGSLPTGFLPAVGYYVIATGLTTNVFQTSSTRDGSAITATGSQSGVHSTGKIKNATIAGPVSIASNATLTIPTNATLVIN